MKKPNKPLFIIDSTHSHGRGRDVEWVSCTSSSTPFVAIASIITEDYYTEHYDPDDVCTAYSLQRNGFRVKVEVTNISNGYDRQELRTLMRRAVKEVVERHRCEEVTSDNITDDNVVWFADKLIEQTKENERENPGDSTNRVVRAILEKIKRDYNNKTA